VTRAGDQTTTYRHPMKALVFVIAGVYVAAMMIAILVLTRPGLVDGVKVGLGFVVSLWSIFRLSRCGIYADHDGIRVLNPLSSTRLRWDEIRRFVLTDRGPSRIERVHGSSVKVFGIQRSTWAVMRSSRRTREAAMIDELNQRLGDRLSTAG
jgi:hypothetical protein